MHIDDPIFENFGHNLWQYSQVPGCYHKVQVPLDKGTHEGIFPLIGMGIIAFANVESWNISKFCPYQAIGFPPIADDHYDLCI
jgi:hypothetical protein